MENSGKMKKRIIISSAPKNPIKHKTTNQIKINWDYMKKPSNSSCSKGSNSNTIIIDDSIYRRFHVLLNDCRHEFGKIWEEKGPRSLLDIRVNSENETIIHYVCQHDNVELAKILLDYRLFLNLLNYGKSMSKETLEKEEFRRFVYSESSSGENAFYQCLKRLDRNKNDALKDILRLFIKSDLLLNTNIYINKRAGYKTTILHLLIESEQFELLEDFIDIYDEYDDDEYDPIDFMKKDFLDRTPLMVALDTGNKEISKLIYKKAKSQMKNEELTRADEYINEFDCDDDNILKKTILQNKLIIVSSKDEIKKLDIMKNQYIREIDGQSFESIWLEYLLLANKFNIVIAERDSESFSDDMKKQIFINRVNKTISERHTLVTIAIVNYSEFYEQLSDFLRFLPYNFKIILVSTNEPVLKLNFSIKQQAFKYQQQTSPALKDNSTVDEMMFEKFINQDIKRLNEYIRDDVGIEEAIKLFKHVLKFEQLPDSLKHLEYKFFDKLGDFCACFYNNFNKSLVYYEKAFEVWPEGETFELANLLIKLGESYLKCDNMSQALKNFSSASEICKKLTPVRNDILGKCFESIAKYYKHGKNSEKEIDYLKKAIESYTGDDLKVASMKNLIFCAYSNQGLENKSNLKEALKYLNESNEFYLNSSQDNQALGKYNLGIAYSEFDDEENNKKAICYYQESIDKNTEFYKENSNINIANALNNIGMVYENLGDHKNAIHHYKRALEMFEIIHKRDHSDLAMVLNNIGTCYDVDECRKEGTPLIILIRLEYLTAAHEMYERLSEKNDRFKEDVAMTAFNMGIAFHDLNRIEKAKDYFEKARQLYDKLEKKIDKLETLILQYDCDKENKSYRNEIIETSKEVFEERYCIILNIAKNFRKDDKNYQDEMLEMMVKVSMRYFSNFDDVESKMPLMSSIKQKAQFILFFDVNQLSKNDKPKFEFKGVKSSLISGARAMIKSC